MSSMLALELAHEEVVYLLRALRLDTLGAITPRALEGLDAQQQALVMSVADRALRARGVVRWVDEEERAVDALIAQVFQAAAVAQLALEISVAKPQSAWHAVALLFSPGIAVRLDSPEPGVHQIIATAAREDVVAMIADLTPFDHPGDPVERGATLSRALLARVTALAPDAAAAEAALLAGGAPPGIASGLATALTQPALEAHLALTDRAGKPLTDGASPRIEFTQGADSLWMLEPATADGEPVSVRSLSAEAARRRIEALAEPALSLLA